jgi:DNA repair exonuclease SbcCD ATPase subunit
MARARPTAPSVSLFPFMSILACLVGTIVVMICILSIIQAQRMGGRPKAEIEMAEDFVAAMEQLETDQEELEKIESKIKELQDDQTQQQKYREELDQRIIKLSLQLEKSKKGEEGNRELQKQLEDAIMQLATLAKDKPPIVKEIDELKKQLAAKKKDPQDLLPKVVVQPGGSGLAGGGNLFFVEATAGALTLYKSKTDKKRITSGSVGTDKEYDEFLQKIQAVPNSTLVFLIRDDGWSAYSRAAGWAEATFQVKTGKLPIPTKGTIDLAQFERFMAP